MNGRTWWRRFALIFWPVAGCGPSHHAEPVLPQLARPAGGPVVAVEIVEAPWVELAANGAVEILRAADGASLFQGELPPREEKARAAVEMGIVRVAGVMDPGPLVLGRLDPRGAAARKGRPLDWIGVRHGDGASRRFRGEIVLEARGDRLRVTNRLPLEEYIGGVVGAEMSASVVPTEALKAQAVAARTYALFSLLAASARGKAARFGSDVFFQVYAGVEKEHPRVLEAVAATAGEVLTYEGGVFRAYYHAHCAGRTADASALFGEPPIEPLRGSTCEACGGSPGGTWTAVVAAAELEGALRGMPRARGAELGSIREVAVVERTADGRAFYVRIEHGAGSFEILASKLRTLLGERQIVLKSTLFEVKRAPGGFLFEGAGRGHGAGLCQTGAAKKGEIQGYREILSGYFPGSALEKVY